MRERRRAGRAVHLHHRQILRHGHPRLSDPTDPWVARQVPVPGSALDVAIDGQHAFVADGWSGLQIIDVADPTNPQLVASVATNYDAKDVAIQGTLAYVANGNDGLLVIDIADPTQPQILGSISVLGRSSSITVAGNLAYIVAGPPGYSSLQVVDVTDPAAPAIVGYADVSGAYVAALTPDHVVLANGSAGVVILPQHCDTETSVTTTVAVASLQAYPNPTSSQTSFRFRAAVTGPVQAAVYDVAGRRVRALASGTMAAGSHELHWNGRDEQGRMAPAGTYLVRVVAGRQAYTSRVARRTRRGSCCCGRL